MQSRDELPEALNALESSFGEMLPAQAEHITIEEVHAFVAAHVARLLDQNPGLLMSILYRIDVSEARVRHVLESEPPDVMVDRLAELIIERQLQKVRLRHQHSQRENN